MTRFKRKLNKYWLNFFVDNIQCPNDHLAYRYSSCKQLQITTTLTRKQHMKSQLLELHGFWHGNGKMR